MYLTMKQQIKQLSKEDYKNLKYLSYIAKNLTNQAIYNRGELDTPIKISV